MMDVLLASVLAGVFGAIAGSFAVTAAMRSAEGQPWAVGRSRCDACGQVLSYARTLPIGSYLIQGGRCAGCGSAISPLHPLAEIAGAVGGVAVVAMLPSVLWGVALGLAIILIFTAAFDQRTYRIPDQATVLVAALGGLGAALRGDLALSLAGAAGVLGLVWLLSLAYRRIRGAVGLGFGDIKLLGALTLWSGPEFAPYAIAGACGLGLLRVQAMGGPSKIPFAPFLAVSFWVAGLARSAT